MLKLYARTGNLICNASSIRRPSVSPHPFPLWTQKSRRGKAPTAMFSKRNGETYLRRRRSRIPPAEMPSIPSMAGSGRW